MAASGNAKVQKLIQSAEEFARKGERQKALTELHKALDIDPGNKDVKKRITDLEREVTAMRNFRKTRDSRTHNTGGAVSSEDFVADCMARSEEAFKQGDEVRALQELERAKRHDPDNRAVQARILTVRRQIKTDNLFDLALAKLSDGDPATAVKNARAIFEAWPSAPVLSDLLDKIEAYRPRAAAPSVAPEEIEEIEEFELDENLEIEEPEPPAQTPREEISPEEAATNSIRAKISRSDFAGALEEARKARASYPGNATIGELVTRLENLAGEKKKPAAAAAVPVKPSKTEKEKKKKSPLGLIVAVLIALILVVVFVVIKPFDATDDTPVTPVEPDFAPYTVSFAVTGPESYSATVDGQPVPVLPDGSFTVEGVSRAERVIEVRATGYETAILETAFESGDDSSLEITLDTLGTNTVQVTFAPSMPEGEAAPAPGAITWLLDGQPVDIAVEVPTGIHVFQAMLEGYNSVPESIFIDYSAGPQQLSLSLLSQTESQIIVALAANVPGSANFAIDGARVGTGVRRISEVLPYGTYQIRVEMEDYEPWVRTVALGEGGYSATVEPVAIVTTGRLLIAPEPWANVSVNGTAMGQTPMAPLELSEGTHTVALTNPDYEDQTLTVTITAGEDTSIRYTADPRAPEGPEVIEEEQPVIPPFPISQIAPETPGLARQMGDVHGYVTLDVVVGTDGAVRNVSIVNDEVGLGCGAAAEAAVRQWVFNPATQGGVPVEVTTRVQVRFDID